MTTPNSTHEAPPVSLTLGHKVFAALVTALIVGLCAWNLSTVVEVASNQKVLRVEIQHLQTDIQAGMSDRYRSGEAGSDFALRDARIDGLFRQIEEIKSVVQRHHELGGHKVMERRMDSVEERINKLEGR